MVQDYIKCNVIINILDKTKRFKFHILILFEEFEYLYFTMKSICSHACIFIFDLSFQSNFSQLYSIFNFDDSSMWSNFSRSSECENEFPSAIEKKTSLFQQLLVVQAFRPDRLQTAMGHFACKALGTRNFLLYKIIRKSILFMPHLR